MQDEFIDMCAKNGIGAEENFLILQHRVKHNEVLRNDNLEINLGERDIYCAVSPNRHNRIWFSCEAMSPKLLSDIKASVFELKSRGVNQPYDFSQLEIDAKNHENYEAFTF